MTMHVPAVLGRKHACSRQAEQCWLGFMHQHCFDVSSPFTVHL